MKVLKVICLLSLIPALYFGYAELTVKLVKVELERQAEIQFISEHVSLGIDRSRISCLNGKCTIKEHL